MDGKYLPENKAYERKEVKKETKSWSHQLNPWFELYQEHNLGLPSNANQKASFSVKLAGFLFLAKEVNEGHIVNKELIKYKQPENPD